ncbi:MAG: transposase [Herminiimonas sp.]|nr:transposase [Herminiimonas sp.]
MKLARLHARIANIRKDARHKFTTSLTRRFHTIGLENLHVRGMLQSRYKSLAVA